MLHQLQDSTLIDSWSIRLRGEYADQALAKLESMQLKGSLKIRIGETFKDWKSNTLEQVLDFRSKYYLLLQEDHLLTCSPNNFDKTILEAMSNGIEILNLSAFETYRETRKIMETLPNFIKNQDLIYGILDKESLEILKQNSQYPRYPVSLLSLLSIKMISKLLMTDRPFWRKFHYNTPFDFEQSPAQSWYLPVKFGLPRYEIYCCIDDDIKIPGSSLQSRGMYPVDYTRKSEHHDLLQLYVKLSPNTNSLHRLKSLVKRLMSLPVKNRIRSSLFFILASYFSANAILIKIGFDGQFFKRLRVRREMQDFLKGIDQVPHKDL